MLIAQIDLLKQIIFTRKNQMKPIDTSLSNATRAKIIQNTKHLTHNTEHVIHNTLLFSDRKQIEISDEMRTSVSPKGPSGLVRPSGETSGEVISFGEVNLGLVNDQIEYLAVSVKSPKPDKPERLDANIDFKLVEGVQFNKLTFDLVHYNRKREFMANIQDREYIGWPGYQQALAQLTNTGFIGKGRNRTAYSLNRLRKRTPIIPETALVLDTATMICYLWIEDLHMQLTLADWQDKDKIFCLKSEYVKQGVMKTWKRGGWL